MSHSTDAPTVDLEAHLGYWLRLVSNHVSGGFARALQARQVSVAEWVALARIDARPNLRPIDLAAELGMTRGAISKVLDKLEQKGWLTQTTSPGDSRVHLLSLTPAGRDVLPELKALADANEERAFAGLGPDDLAVLRALLVRLAQHNHLHTVPTE